VSKTNLEKFKYNCTDADYVFLVFDLIDKKTFEGVQKVLAP